jgi:hypothetical protein
VGKSLDPPPPWCAAAVAGGALAVGVFPPFGRHGREHGTESGSERMTRVFTGVGGLAVFLQRGARSAVRSDPTARDLERCVLAGHGPPLGWAA